MRNVSLMSLVVLAGLIGAGCQNALHDENLKYRQQNLELQTRLDDASAKNRMLADQLASRDREIAAMKAAAIAVPPPPPPPPPTTAPPTGFEGMDATVDAKAGTITVSVAGDVLFDSGKAELKSTAKATLDKILAVLNQKYAGKEVRVEGHTDTDPIKASNWKDNWDLSLARAETVGRHLLQAGLDPKRLAIAGHGEYRPRTSPQDKARNRRVEIVVVMR